MNKKQEKHIEATRRRKCPKCGSKSYMISIPIEHIKEYKNGKLWRERGPRRYDAGGFWCAKCDYKDTF